jgi:hypothetical protein
VSSVVRVNEMALMLFLKLQRRNWMRKREGKRKWKVCIKYEWHGAERLRSGRIADGEEERRVIEETSWLLRGFAWRDFKQRSNERFLALQL